MAVQPVAGGYDIGFGRFLLRVSERLLESEGTPVPLGGRALDLLIALVENSGQVVGKRDLLATVWPDVTVDEGSLRVHVAALRKALGEGIDGSRFITNVPGRGYCFVAPIWRGSDRLLQPGTSGSHQPSLPAASGRVIGRASEIRRVVDLLEAHGLVCVVGPGGVGKTTVATAACAAWHDRHGSRIFFVDLSSIAEGTLVPSALGLAFGIAVSPSDPVASIVAHYRDDKMLVVLDNCEHVIDQIALVAERMGSALPNAKILASSREPLRAVGEQVLRLGPLECPPEAEELTSAQIAAFPAVELFLDRAAGTIDAANLSREEASSIAEICRKVGGLALAVELAAGQVDALGVGLTSTMLDTRLGLSWHGRRTAPARHQSLIATLEWSCQLLSPAERRVLDRISLLTGIFDVEAACTIAADGSVTVPHAIDALDYLVDKSLVTAVVNGDRVRYRLPETTRAYILETFRTDPDFPAAARRHAEHFTKLLRKHAALANSGSTERNSFAEHVGNIRVALKWSFEEAGDFRTAILLATAAAPLMLRNSILEECRHWTGLAIAQLGQEFRQSRTEMELRTYFGLAAMFTGGNNSDVYKAFSRALEIAEDLGDADQAMGLIGGLHIVRMKMSDPVGGLAFAERGASLAEKMADPTGVAQADWMIIAAHHILGNLEQVEAHRAAAVGHPPLPHRVNTLHFGFDLRGPAICALARNRWLRGQLVEAKAEAIHVLREGSSADPIPKSFILSWIAPVLIGLGEMAMALEAIEHLLAHSARFSVYPYHLVGLSLRDQLNLATADDNVDLEAFRERTRLIEDMGFGVHNLDFHCVLADGYLRQGRFEEGSQIVDLALTRIDRLGETFMSPEVYRLKGEIPDEAPIAATDAPNAWHRRALDVARRQGAAVWELRAAASIVRGTLKRGVGPARLSELREIRQRFADQPSTPDTWGVDALLRDAGGRPAAPVITAAGSQINNA
jgi:predicted ATPase/DNA-binding winged helix-turn-helix (wHTH) protein